MLAVFPRLGNALLFRFVWAACRRISAEGAGWPLWEEVWDSPVLGTAPEWRHRGHSWALRQSSERAENAVRREGMGTETVRNSRERREMRRWSPWKSTAHPEDSRQGKGTDPEKLWLAQTGARFPEELQPMEKPCQSRGKVWEGTSSEGKLLHRDCMCPQFSLCWSGREESGMKLSLGKEGRKAVVLRRVFFFTTTQTSYCIFILTGNKLIFSQSNLLCLQQ